MWKFLVKHQKIEILEREIIADHQISFVNLKFIFDGDWKKFHKVVQFSQCDETYNRVLGTDGLSCLLPAELHAGVVKMSVFGYDAKNTAGLRATTVPVMLHIRHSGFVDDSEESPIPPTPDLYTQLLNKLEEKADSLQNGIDGKDGLSAYELAKENGFDGTLAEWLESLKGDVGPQGKTGNSIELSVQDNNLVYRPLDDIGNPTYMWMYLYDLSTLKGADGKTPDMSEYPKTTDVEKMIKAIDNTEEISHAEIDDIMNLEMPGDLEDSAATDEDIDSIF